MRSNKLFHSATFRLALVYAALFSLSVLVLLGFIYWSTAGYMARQTDATIKAEIKGLAERYESDGLTGLSNQLADRLAKQKPGDSSIYLLTDARYRPIVGNLNRWPETKPDKGGWLDFRLGDDVSGKLHRARARAFVISNRFHLLVGRDTYEFESTQNLIVRTLIWGLLITLALALLGGVMMSRSMMARIDGINRAIGEIMSGNLARRIPNRRSGDELDRLAENLNRMLDQIELLMDGVRRVSDNIAHDLKTPLARLRNRLEALGKTSINEEERLELADRALSEADGLLQTFNALLRIARIEAEARQEAFRVLDLKALVSDVVELYEPLVEEKQQSIALQCGGAVAMQGDRDLLFQAVANLADNAIKYTPHGGRITISLEPGSLSVCDNGPGIPEQDRDKVFQRFYRAEQSRTTSGSGLGLSLVRAVAQLHYMEINLSDNEPGLCVSLNWKM